MNITSTTIQGDIVVIACQIENLDASNVKSFKEAIHPLIKDQNKIILNLSEIKFIDSSGLGALISVLREVNGRAGNLKLCSLTRAVRALFELMRMNRIFSIFESQEDALKSFSS